MPAYRYGKIRSFRKPRRGVFKKVLMFMFFFFVSFSLLLSGFYYFQINKKNAAELKGSAQNFTSFKDVSASDEGFQAVAYYEKRGVLKGYANGTFKPDDRINRAEFIALVDSVKNVYPHPLLYSRCYKDVKNEWFSGHVCYAKDKQWVNPDVKNFSPGNNIKLSEAIKIAALAFGFKPDHEAAPGEPWYKPYSTMAYDKEWIDAPIDNDVEISRIQAVNLLYQVEKLGLTAPSL